MDADIAKFFYDLGQLKRVRRSGWWVAGIDDAESVAAHTFRTAAIAYVLAEIEGANPDRAAALAVFHDVAETRVNDQHHMAKSYGDNSEAESRVIDDQCAHLPSGLADRLRSLWSEAKERRTREGIIAKDADLLECLIQAREYEAQGSSSTRQWMDTARANLATDAAKKIADACLELSPSSWWQED